LRRNRFQALGICCIAGAKQRVRPEPAAQSAWIAADRRPIPVDGDARTANFGDRGSVRVLPARRCRQLRICRAINTCVLVAPHHRRHLDDIPAPRIDCAPTGFAAPTMRRTAVTAPRQRPFANSPNASALAVEVSNPSLLND
jgi:hypothetical protein